ncbi:MAG: hypothetical protein DWQ08_01605 [Proteobacteria bacterium]|nr:MAG: hypothetical protein DWQ08_01605 [Pseudomonadota bacterium]
MRARRVRSRRDVIVAVTPMSLAAGVSRDVQTRFILAAERLSRKNRVAARGRRGGIAGQGDGGASLETLAGSRSRFGVEASRGQ